MYRADSKCADLGDLWKVPVVQLRKLADVLQDLLERR